MAILKFFGVEIRTGRDQSHHQQPAAPALPAPEPLNHVFGQVSSGQQLLLSNGVAVEQPAKKGNFLSTALNGVKIATKQLSPREMLAKDIVYPAPPTTTSPYRLKEYENYLLECKKMIEEENFFSICDVDKLIKICNITNFKKDIYRYVNSMHCKHYHEMSSYDIEMLFESVTHIFTEGRYGGLDCESRVEVRVMKG